LVSHTSSKSSHHSTTNDAHQPSRQTHYPSRRIGLMAGSVLAFALLLVGCGQQTASRVPNLTNAPAPTKGTTSNVQRVIQRSYNAKTQTVTLTLRRDGVLSGRGVKSATGTGTVEDLLDVNDKAAIANYATAMYPRETVRRVKLNYIVTRPNAPYSMGGVPGSTANWNGLAPNTGGGALRNGATGNTPTTNAGGTAAAAGTSQAPMGAVAAGTVQYVMTNKGWVSYHASPSTSSAVLGRLQSGDKAPLVAKTNAYWYQISWQGRNVYITANSAYTHVVTAQTSTNTATTTASSTVTVPPTIAPATPATVPSAGQGAAASSISLPPPGVTWDTSITPQAPRTASVAAKTTAVLNVAKSKLGTPYIWGHNEDRGQYGFDCSNFTEYVYHHALGYKFTTASRGQYQSVGVNVPTSQMRPGDLLIFNQGGHVGIYSGNNQMIEEGGGLGKVGYLSVAPSSYWGSHLSAVRRMF